MTKRKKTQKHEFEKTSLGAKCRCGGWIVFGRSSAISDLFKEHVEHCKE